MNRLSVLIVATLNAPAAGLIRRHGHRCDNSGSTSTSTWLSTLGDPAQIGGSPADQKSAAISWVVEIDEVDPTIGGLRPLSSLC